MELGGKSPAVVFADADLEPPSTRPSSASSPSTASAAPPGRGSWWSARSTTSSWSATPRGQAHHGRRPARPDHRGRRAGPPGALRQGHVLRGDRQERGPPDRRRRPPGGFPEGNYVAPTVFADVAPDARIFQEEIFGPVVAITPFDTDEEALELANNTKYGLAAYIWTNDLKRRTTSPRTSRPAWSG